MTATPLGSAQNEECQIDSIAQSWAVISARPRPSMPGRPESAGSGWCAKTPNWWPCWRRLSTMPSPAPAIFRATFPARAENGGQYTHARCGWRWRTSCRRWRAGRPPVPDAQPDQHTRGPKMLSATKPSRMWGRGRVLASDAPGRGGWTWYTGSAAWMYRVALEGILGLQRRGDTLSLQPCLPRRLARIPPDLSVWPRAL